MSGSRAPRRHTNQHPHREADPRALVQLHHEVDVHKDAQDGEGRQEWHLQRDKAAGSVPVERGLVAGPISTTPQIYLEPRAAEIDRRPRLRGVDWALVPPLHPNPHTALDPQAPPRTSHARTFADKPGRREFGSKPTAKDSAVPVCPCCYFLGSEGFTSSLRLNHFRACMIYTTDARAASESRS